MPATMFDSCYELMSVSFQYVSLVDIHSALLHFTVPLAIYAAIFVYRPQSGRAVFFLICVKLSDASPCSGSYDPLEHNIARSRSIGHELVERGLI